VTNINEKIIQTLEEQNIGLNTGLLCLLGIYHNVDFEPLYDACNIITVAVKQLNASGIYEYDMKTNSIKWHIPLFDNDDIKDDGWEWVYEYQNLFRLMRKDAASTFDNVKKKMIKFFQENPSVRADDVMKATKAYLDTINDVRYLQRADYFIKKNGPDPQSRLKEYLELSKTKSSKTYDMM